jgi:hypothetical protein
MSETILRRIGWVMSGLFAVFMLGASATPKLAGMAVAQDTMNGLGWPDAPLALIGCMEVGFTLLFLFPPTALLGAVLMMGVLGGAVATNLHAHAPLYSNTMFSIYLGTFMWTALWCRDPRIRAVFPLIR